MFSICYCLVSFYKRGLGGSGQLTGADGGGEGGIEGRTLKQLMEVQLKMQGIFSVLLKSATKFQYVAPCDLLECN